MAQLHDKSPVKFFAAAMLFMTLFQLATQYRLPPTSRVLTRSTSTVVIDAPVQVLMYAGDRFLAANLEAIRVAAIGASEDRRLADFRARSQSLISQLNACHEDNYYIANAMLSWGGSDKEGNAILQRATECRTWDDIPPFLLGFNRYFFYQDFDGAREAINTAASRSVHNRAQLKNISIAMTARELNDTAMAASYIRNQRDTATDPQLAEMLDRRLRRLEGLITLRNAQALFENDGKRKLMQPDELITSGILHELPQDPMRIGYEFLDGNFRLRALIIGGVEIR